MPNYHIPRLKATARRGPGAGETEGSRPLAQYPFRGMQPSSALFLQLLSAPTRIRVNEPGIGRVDNGSACPLDGIVGSGGGRGTR
jgi:hypothetical protein